MCLGQNSGIAHSELNEQKTEGTRCAEPNGGSTEGVSVGFVMKMTQAKRQKLLTKSKDKRVQEISEQILRTLIRLHKPLRINET
ncbi:hypothetical protein T265_01962 [Opisthorchis viverrini]|uniref:Uncharacterized protein n=1 Tax=Opisthorchis viverrini TaxID=6198 RepID=A0A075AIM1_OPIVI|nr:hypothetical protein T265_01962 [Opisthorchis viverrini]KER31874.1 hypothetical protein T265_01962 [Opisthorchis viverrini]